MIVQRLRDVLQVPRVADRPGRTSRDWLLVTAFMTAAVIEGLVRPDIEWRWFSILLAVGLGLGFLWRRSHPGETFFATFGVLLVANVVDLATGSEWEGLYTMAAILILPYALFRWGAGWEAAVGLAQMVVIYVLALLNDYTGLGDAIGGAIVFAFPAELGLLIRTRAASQARQLEQVKAQERELLARELHDTVAHHVSAIAIQAQAGRAVAATDPRAAVDALEVIEEAAARTLDDMRSMVGVLRGAEPAEMSPQPGVTDIARLASDAAEGPPIEVAITGDVDALAPAVDGAVYRMAQESITNAVRHARNATRIVVAVVAEDSRVRLTVSDDGDPVPALSSTANRSGFGLVGMSERAALLGGTLHVGPGPGRGWTVEAELPRTVSR